MPPSTHHFNVNNRTMVPPIKMGERKALYLLHEVEAVIRARIAGKTTDELRALVADLVAARQVAS